jgi:hypothetical protein
MTAKDSEPPYLHKHPIEALSHPEPSLDHPIGVRPASSPAVGHFVPLSPDSHQTFLPFR